VKKPVYTPIPEKKTEITPVVQPAKLIPASVKVEVDNSTIIIAVLAAGLFFWLKK
jgi:hypothetical protein